MAHAGEHVGAIAVLSNEPSLFSCRARADSVVVCFSSAQFAAIAAQYPQALFALTELLIRRLSPFMRAMDYGAPLTMNTSHHDGYRLVIIYQLHPTLFIWHFSIPNLFSHKTEENMNDFEWPMILSIENAANSALRSVQFSNLGS